MLSAFFRTLARLDKCGQQQLVVGASHFHTHITTLIIIMSKAEGSTSYAFRWIL